MALIAAGGESIVAASAAYMKNQRRNSESMKSGIENSEKK